MNTGRSVALFLGMALALAASGTSVIGAEEPKPDEVELVRERVQRKDGYFQVEYGGYRIRTDIDEQYTAEAAVYMRKFKTAFGSFFKLKPQIKATPTLYIFKDERTYWQYGRDHGLKDKLIGLGGFYVPTSRTLLAFNEKPGAAFKESDPWTIRHEAGHQLLHFQLGRRSPAWFDEGVATCLEGWDVELSREKNIEKMKKLWRFDLIRKTFGTRDFLDLDELMLWGKVRRRPNGRPWDAEQLYAEAQSFMSFLLTSEKGRKFFVAVYRCVAKGQDPAEKLGNKAVASAQAAWYRNIEEQINPSQ